MNSRRDFLTAMSGVVAVPLTACGGGGGDGTSADAKTQSQSSGSKTVDPVPAGVVVEDWSTGVAKDAGRIDFTALIRSDAFADAALAADCAGWDEHGPSSVTSLPVLGGVRFTAKRFTIKAGGRYSQTSYRVLVMMQATGLADGLYGDIRGVDMYPGPHKLRIVNADGVELQRIEMRDGLPMNHASLVNVPVKWTVNSRPTSWSEFPSIGAMSSALPGDKAMRPWMGAGSTYVAFFGDTPTSSAAVRDRIPRVRTDLWHEKATKVRSIYNGDDVHLFDVNFGGNGNAHPEVIPQWAKSMNEINAIAAVGQKDPDITAGWGGNWVNAYRVGWGYEPGALGGITRRGGPGGQRIDRTVLPNEIFQMALSQTVRKNDDTPTADMARGMALNHANYPGYYPRSLLTLDAINQFDSTPQPTIAGGAATPVFHYYGTSVGQSGNPSAIWISDAYGGWWANIAASIEWANPGTGSTGTTKSHPRNGWCPDAEHNNRVGTAWAALMYADPMFSRMAEHMMMFESNLMAPFLKWATYSEWGTPASTYIAEPGSFWSRPSVLPFCTATLMWWVASTSGVYTRAQIEERITSFFTNWKRDVRDKLPTKAAATTASQRAHGWTGGVTVGWATWSGEGNHAAGSGWIAPFTLAWVYLGQLLMLMKSSGLYDVLMKHADAAVCISDIEKQLAVNARLFADAPWAVVSTGQYTSPLLVLRTQAQGAVQSDLSTVPNSLDEVVGYNPSPRSDEHWYLRAGVTPGTAPLWAVCSDGGWAFNYAGFARQQTAHAYWAMLAAKGTDQAQKLAKVEDRIKRLNAYSNLYYDAGLVRFNSVQSVPALGV